MRIVIALGGNALLKCGEAMTADVQRQNIKTAAEATAPLVAELGGVEGVIDKDLCSELLARELDADLFIMATDAEAIYTGWGTADQKAVFNTPPEHLSAYPFPAGSMGPKVEAACHFARKTGHSAAIGALADIPAMVRAEPGAIINSSFPK
nr:hypothetical protein [Sinorhizobium medicae]